MIEGPKFYLHDFRDLGNINVVITLLINQLQIKMKSPLCTYIKTLFCFSRSNARRDQIGPYLPCDTTWLGNEPLNPLAVGQYVNNRTKNVPANVAYQEVDIPFKSIAPKLWKNLPNIWYSSGNIVNENAFLRAVALVSVREINEGEEVFSSYFTVVH